MGFPFGDTSEAEITSGEKRFLEWKLEFNPTSYFTIS